TLHYEDEIRKSDPFFSQISGKKAEADPLEAATAPIEKKSAPVDAGASTDHYQSALRELSARKMKDKRRKIRADKGDAAARPRGENVVDLMAALKESLEGGSKKSSGNTSAAKPAAKKPAASKTSAATRKKAS